MSVEKEKDEWVKKTIKVDENKWRELKAKAIKKGKYTYELLDEILGDNL